MKLFRDMRGGQFQPGPGVDGPPPSVGFPRFWYILRNHPGKLILGNVLFVLFSVPIITAPAALCGLNAVIARLMLSGHCYTARDFVDGFRRRFWSKTLMGLPFFVVIAGAVLLYEAGRRGVWLYVAFVAACFFFFAACCFFALTTRESEPVGVLYLRAFALCFSGRRVLRLLPALLSAVVFLFFRVALLPVFVLIGMSLTVILAHAAIQDIL